MLHELPFAVLRQHDILPRRRSSFLGCTPAAAGATAATATAAAAAAAAAAANANATTAATTTTTTTAATTTTTITTTTTSTISSAVANRCTTTKRSAAAAAIQAHESAHGRGGAAALRAADNKGQRFAPDATVQLLEYVARGAAGVHLAVRVLALGDVLPQLLHLRAPRRRRARYLSRRACDRMLAQLLHKR